MKIQLCHNQDGFTFIEAIIYMAIIGGVLAAFIQFVLSISDTRNKSFALQEVQVNARIVSEVFSSQMRQATGVVFASSTFESHPGTLVLSMASSTLDPTIITVSDSRVVIKQGSAPTSTLTSNRVSVRNLVFTNQTGNSARENIELDVTVEFLNPSNDGAFQASDTMNTAVSIRQ